MELRHLRYFVQALESGSITAAATRLHVSQPAVSRQLKDLEEELGTPLFDRTHTGLVPTQAGWRALEQARNILDRAEELKASVRPPTSRKRLELQVGYLPTALSGFLTEAMKTFRLRHPDACVQIREMNPARQEEALEKNEIDLALLGTSSPEARKKFETTEIFNTPLALVLPREHRLAGKKPIAFSEMKGEPFITLNENLFPKRQELVEELGRRSGFRIDVALRADGLSEALGLVAGGGGIAALPRDAESLPHPGAVFITMSRPRIRLSFEAAWNPRVAPPELEEWIQILKEAHAAKKLSPHGS